MDILESAKYYTFKIIFTWFIIGSYVISIASDTNGRYPSNETLTYLDRTGKMLSGIYIIEFLVESILYLLIYLLTY